MLRTAGFKKYLHNTSWLFVERVVRLVVVLATSILVARYLGGSLFGQLNYATGFVGIFFALTTMGLDEIVVRDLVRHPERRDELLGTSAVIKFGGASLLVLLVVLSTFLKNMEGVTASLVIVIAVAELLRPFHVIDYYFMAQVKARSAVVVQMAQVFISAAAKLWLVFRAGSEDLREESLILFAWIYVLETFTMSVGYAWMYKAGGAAVRAWRYSRKMALHLLDQSWPLVIYGMALYVQAKIDQVMIGDMLTRTLGEKAAFDEVGQYSVALKMIEAMGFLPVIVQKSLAPAITRAKLESEAKYRDRLLNQYRLMFLMFLVTSVPLFFLAEPLIVLLYGPEFAPAGYLLGLFAIRLFFTNMGVGKSSFITNESLFRYSLFTAIVGAVVNITMNWLLIPELRSIGAIWATIGSFLISIFLLDLFFKDTRNNLRDMVMGILTFWRIGRAR